MDNLISSFDIDSTIFNVSPRNQAIFDLFLALNIKKHEELLKFDSKTKLTAYDWGLDPYIEQLGGKNAELHKQAARFWRTHFFAGTFLNSDTPYPYAVEWVKKLASKGAYIKYLTGRDDHRMRAGTLAQLKHWQLPLVQDNDLITKPSKGMQDGPYKRNALEKLINDFSESKVFFLDNEPAVINHCLFPDKTNYQVVFIESTHSRRSTPQKDWAKVHAFEYEKIFQKT